MPVPEKYLDRTTFKFVQEGNSLGTTSDTEVLDVELEHQLPDEGPFVVIRTEGWSVNEGWELERTVENCVAAWEAAHKAFKVDKVMQAKD